MVERVSTLELYDQYSQGVQKTQLGYHQSYQTLLSGKNFVKPSDNPAQYNLTVEYGSVQNQLNQYQENILLGQQLLTLSNNALDEAYNILQKAQSLTLQGANKSTSVQSLQALSIEVVSLQQQLVDLANSQNGDRQYLFSGQKTFTQPFTVSGTSLVYNGDTNNLTIEIAPGVTTTINVQGGTLFTQAYQTLQTLQEDLLANNPTNLSGIDLLNVQNSMQAISQQQGMVGGQIQRLEDISAYNDRRIEELSNQISDVQDVDWPSAIISFNEARDVYLAVLEATSKITQFSLLDFLK